MLIQSPQLIPFPVPDVVIDPDPPAFVAACILLGVLVLAWCHQNQTNKFQKRFLIHGVTASLLLGVSANSVADTVSSICILLPITAMLSLVLSQFAAVTVQCLQSKGGTRIRIAFSRNLNRESTCVVLENV